MSRVSKVSRVTRVAKVSRVSKVIKCIKGKYVLCRLGGQYYERVNLLYIFLSYNFHLNSFI